MPRFHCRRQDCVYWHCSHLNSVKDMSVFRMPIRSGTVDLKSLPHTLLKLQVYMMLNMKQRSFHILCDKATRAAPCRMIRICHSSILAILLLTTMAFHHLTCSTGPSTVEDGVRILDEEDESFLK